MRLQKSAIAIALALTGVALSGFTGVTSAESSADILFTGKYIYTVNPDQPWAKSVAISGDEIVCVSETTSCEKLANDQTERISLGEGMLLPGFIDGHYHALAGSMIAGKGVDLRDAENEQDYIEALKAYKKANPDAEFITGFGWKPYGFIAARQTLDTIYPDTPVLLIEITGHAGWANTAALKATSNLTEPNDVIPGFSFVEVGGDGKATGYIAETPQTLTILQHFITWDRDFYKASLAEQHQKLAEAGITAYYDAGWYGFFDDQGDGFGLMNEVADSNQLKARVRGSYYATGGDEAGVDAILNWRKSGVLDHSPLIGDAVLKLNLDGDPAGYAVYLLEDYTSRPGDKGKPLYTAKQTNALVANAYANSIDIHTHAMGDAAVRQFVDAAEKAKAKHPDSTTRISLAHTYLVSPEDYQRIAKLGMVTSFAGQWAAATPDNTELTDQLGSRLETALFPAGQMAKADVKLSIGSDFPASGFISSDRILPQIETLITRKQFGRTDVAELPPADAKISMEQAIAAATINNAYQLNMESQIGSIEVGKKADLVFLDENLFTVEKHKINSVKVNGTMVNGNWTHRDQ